MNYFKTKWVSKVVSAVLVLMACPLFAAGQGQVAVTATAGAPWPAWVPYGEESDTALSATAIDPTPGSGQTLIGPTWGWVIVTVETSSDGITYGTPGAYQASISPNNSATAILQAKFYQGAYWRITCQATAGYSETPGTATWTGAATCAPKPNSGQLIAISVLSGATTGGNVTGGRTGRPSRREPATPLSSKPRSNPT